MAIQSFASTALEEFFVTKKLRKPVGWSNVKSVVIRKLDMLHYAKSLLDLRSPPANRLEALRGNLRGYHSIRVNDQWRVIFRWTVAGPESVDVVDYH